MGSEVFEIGLFRPDAELSGVGPVMIPRTWNTEDVLRSIPWMKLQNLQGRNIYVRPQGEHNLTMVDDLKHEGVKRMFESGFKPALVVETSRGNFQAWLKHPHVLDKELSTAAARALADELGGDKGAADWRHFGRLAGFTNRKLKYQIADGLFPFVRLISASGEVYPNAEKFLARVEAQLAAERRRSEERQLKYRTGQTGPRRTIDEFRSNPLYGGDGTRIDLAYAIYALSHGAREDQVRQAIRSRDLSHKGSEKRQAEYVDRTINKAISVVERSQTALSR
jgi:hypothetical protein